MAKQSKKKAETSHPSRRRKLFFSFGRKQQPEELEVETETEEEE